MAVIRCEDGHYYDSEKYQSCPHCLANSNRAEEDAVTVSAPDASNIFALAAQSSAAINSSLSVLAGDESTLRRRSSHDFDPVVGWLVCVGGPDRGRDHRVHLGQNFIGRSVKSDLVISGDEQVSHKNHCVIVYDPKSNSFFLTPGDGVGLWLNGELLTNSNELKDLDKVSFGGSEFVFVALCREGFSWQ